MAIHTNEERQQIAIDGASEGSDRYAFEDGPILNNKTSTDKSTNKAPV